MPSQIMSHEFVGAFKEFIFHKRLVPLWNKDLGAKEIRNPG